MATRKQRGTIKHDNKDNEVVITQKNKDGDITITQKSKDRCHNNIRNQRQMSQ